MAWQTPKTNWTAADGVRDYDLNRIEGNLLALYNGGSGFADITINVATTGSDTPGAGTSASPYRTITYALSTLPKNLNGKNVLVYIATGTYEENVVVKGFSNGTVVLAGYYGRIATIQSLEINSSICEIRSLALRITAGGVTVTNGAALFCGGSIEVSGSAKGLYVTNCSMCRVHSQLTIDAATAYAVHVNGASIVYILSLAGSDNEVAILAEEGSRVSYGNTNISTVTSSFVYRTGGRIYTAS